jgi:membrane associated rhomboid family serine protease
MESCFPIILIKKVQIIVIPLRDKNPTKSFPFVTIVLIVLNIAVFIYEISLGAQTELFIAQYGVVPNNIHRMVQLHAFNPLIIITLLTSIFLHGGWLHLAGNMLYLWIFGDNVEDKTGHIRFFLFYVLTGIIASLLQIYINPISTIPTIGASGAISGVLGAYLLMFPRARVVTLIPIFIFIQIAELPAYLILGFWFVFQFLNGMISMGNNANSAGIAWWAHIGGFIAGMILIFPFRIRR